MLNEDNISYFKYTGPQRLDKAIHVLEGIIQGITIDGKATDRELSALTGWLAEHREFVDRHPFNEVIPCLNEILSDDAMDEEERADILWLCERLDSNKPFFSQASSDMQRLHGLMAGIAADGTITEEELSGLREWIDEHTDLRTCWPYDELDALLLSVLADGVIDPSEHEMLLQFFREFTVCPGHRAIQLSETQQSPLVSGVCAVCPEIVFADRKFCFTGRSKRCSREELAQEIERRGGLFSKTLVKTVDYLVIGADGNPCWAYACYGRKVEEAVKYRKAGCKIVLVH